MKVIVVGGAGYVGSHTTHALAAAGYEITVIDDLSTGHREFVPISCRLVTESILRGDRLQEIVADINPQLIYHFAARALVEESEQKPLDYYISNVAGTLNLLNAALLAGCRQFVFSSTAAVYGVPTQLPIEENAAIAPINSYGRSKAMIETVLSDLSQKGLLRYVALRYFNAGGASYRFPLGERHDPESHLIPRLINSLLHEREFLICGHDYATEDGTCIRDFIHVDDLADAHIRAADYLREGHPSNVFNLGSTSGYSIRQIISTVEQVTRRKVRLKTVGRRPGDPPVLVANSQKAQNGLGWVPRYSINDIVSTAWRWHSREAERVAR